MKKVSKVSIAGYAFTLDTEAYGTAKKYLDELEAFYSSKEGGSEIVDGIEDRFAELIFSKCGPQAVVSDAIVKEIISVIGVPSEFGTEDSAPEVKIPKKSEKKRLYRDSDNHMLGGVCSGLAKYFGVDVVLIRIAWLILLMGGFIISDKTSWDSCFVFVALAYVALWISMPVPKTVIEKKNYSDYPKTKSSFWSTLGSIFRVFIGLVLILAGASILVAGLVVCFGWASFDIMGMIPFYMEEALFRMPSLPLTITVFFLPCLIMLYEGIKMLFQLRSPKYHPGFIAALLWFMSVMALVCIQLPENLRALF